MLLLADPTAPVADQAQEAQGGDQTPVLTPWGPEDTLSEEPFIAQEALWQGYSDPAWTVSIRHYADQPVHATSWTLAEGELWIHQLTILQCNDRKCCL